MQAPEVTDGLFEAFPEPIGPGWRFRVFVIGEPFLQRAVPVVARVGDVPVESIAIAPDGTGFVGFLSDEPADGAKLEVGYADTGFVSTGVTYQAGGNV